MKKLLIIIDGMEDEPCASLGGKTPKEVATCRVLNLCDLTAIPI